MTNISNLNSGSKSKVATTVAGPFCSQSRVQHTLWIALIFSVLLFPSCEKFLEVELPRSKIPNSLVFSDPNSATSAITGIYVDMLDGLSYSSGTNYSLTVLAGLSADELINYYQEPDFMAFQENDIAPVNPHITSLWNSFYKIIYQTNAAIEGLNNSTGLSQSVKDRLHGECLVVRALSYFYLVNTFGPAPLTTVTDYETNQTLSREPEDKIYEQVEADLVEAQSLLVDDYPTTTRIRPNRGTATALLARVYLYKKEWDKAIEESSKVIASSMYQLEPNLSDVFLTTSREAIWQLGNSTPDYNTNEGLTFMFNGGPQSNILRPDVFQDFEDNDNRLTSWVGVFDTGTELLYYPSKYKKFLPIDLEHGEQVTEYSTVARLAEQYLIRAECRAHLADLPGAIADLDTVRVRAGLFRVEDQMPGVSQNDLLNIIQHERRIEFFTEWGHRWYDLKRTNMANNVLQGSKSAWNTEDVLYPVPQVEFTRNPYLGQQNEGY